jgi:hypothetical protein
MFEGDSADMCAGKFPLMSMGGARTPIGVSGNLIDVVMPITYTGKIIYIRGDICL